MKKLRNICIIENKSDVRKFYNTSLKLKRVENYLKRRIYRDVRKSSISCDKELKTKNNA